MRMKLIKLNQHYLIILGLILFFFLLRQNQIFFLNNQTSKSIIDYIFFYLNNFHFIEIITYLFLLLPGYILIKSKVSFTNTTIFFFYIFFFTPFLIFFLKLNNEFYEIITSKKISLNQIDLFKLAICLYSNLILLVFFSKIRINFKFKYFYFTIKKVKLLCMSLISLVILYFILFIFFKKNINIIYFLTLNSDYRVFLSGTFGYMYYSCIYIFLPLFYLLDKKNINLFYVTILYLIFFFIFKEKINLFIIITLIIYHNNFFLNIKNIYLYILKIILIYLVLAFLLSFIANHFYQIKTSLYFERLFLSQTKNLFFVYDFFNNKSPLFLTHISIFNDYYPFEKNFYDLIKEIYGGGSAVSNSYIMDGLASFGLVGLFFTSLVLIIILKIIDALIDFENNDFKLIYFFQIIGFLSYPLSTQLITYGLTISIFLGMIRIKR